MPQVAPENPYGYVPDDAICIMFIVLFAISSTTHLGQAFWKRTWFMIPTVVLSGCLEILGWSARLWSSKNILLSEPFSIQISTLIIGPTPLLAADFIIFGRLVGILGTQYSRLSPRLYARIFLTCDIISLVLQGIGGGWASSASNNGGDIDPGTNLMIAGIVFQLIVIVVFATLAAEFAYRFFNDSPFAKHSASANNRGDLSGKRKLALGGIAFTIVVLAIRAIYRVIELSQGWRSKLMHTQWLFGLFDSAMVILAFYCWNAFHPGWTVVPDTQYFNKEFSRSGSA
ncbi:hypothetical protein D9758_005036 [Tetrapyrgos nigripes]|uniref:RTA1-domain-containing protein n=1 Tax=Tetrapyrgos nigripes TaxID=182062 RepID=A0A8H5LWL4_9AGAR|nr:hypothetical protein D9758_005036 [Tetrapyrgos nigripes]